MPWETRRLRGGRCSGTIDRTLLRLVEKGDKKYAQNQRAGSSTNIEGWLQEGHDAVPAKRFQSTCRSRIAIERAKVCPLVCHGGIARDSIDRDPAEVARILKEFMEHRLSAGSVADVELEQIADLAKKILRELSKTGIPRAWHDTKTADRNYLT